MVYRIGSGQGFYGDNVLNALPMITGDHVDAVCFEALAEVTLAILQKDRLKDPSRGYTFDINVIAQKVLPEAYQRKIPLITNGGGLNPVGAGEKVREIASQLGLSGLKIATITGDDILPYLKEWHKQGKSLKSIGDGHELDFDEFPIVNANVYIGAAPIVDALRNGADIVITGRVADPCLYLAPLIAHYDWEWDDWDRLASGIIAGHLLECTGQVVGGNSLAIIDQLDPNDLDKLGYPIAHVEENGDFTITSTPDQPAYVTIDTVKEQLLYEIHDPANYITPDVIADITTLSLNQVSQNHVKVCNVTGKPRPEKLKLNLGRLEGYTKELIFMLGWPQAVRKYDQLKIMIENVVKDLPIDRTEYSLLGVNSLYGNIALMPVDPLELSVRVVFSAKDESTLQLAMRKIIHAGLSSPSGMSISPTTISTAPRVIVGLWSTLIDRNTVTPEISYTTVP